MTHPAQTSEWVHSKKELRVRGGMVTAEHHLAAQAGVDILREGGNAVDAAVAAAFVMGVVEPFTSGIGGIAGLVIRRADGTVASIDGGTRAPKAAHAAMFELQGGGARSGMYAWPAVKDNANIEGPLSVGVMGQPAALCLALERYGTMPRARVMESAIRIAREGFEVDWYVSLSLAMYHERLHRAGDGKTIFFRPSGAPLRPPIGTEPSDKLMQADLARSLEAIAKDGPSVMYDGELGREIVKGVRASGGILADEDLRGYAPTEAAPLETMYRGQRLLTLPGLTGGPTVARALAILDSFTLRGTEQGSADHLHLVAEALRGAFLHRFSQLADHTTHLNAIDQDRNMVALTQTLGQGFGSGFVPKGTGVVLLDTMTWFDPVPDHPNSVAPGKRVLWAGAPTLILNGGRPRLAVGAPGGRKIMSAVAQSIVNVIDFDDGPQDAVNRPRVHDEGEGLLVDSRIPDAVRADLAERGHTIVVKEETLMSAWFARPQAIGVDDGGDLCGGVDALKPAVAVGY
ncbi:MAG TPA: gamma-glutamyltransferase [Candidatus Limnocylindrales bacterium]|nr:gamma-glutamyltransferase [Candidatus Limnocylindrales bacterium]